MTKVGVLFPFEEMMDIGKPLIDKEDLNVCYLEVTSTPEVVDAARHAIEQGAEIIISRGHQASLLKRYTKIPVVDMRIHAQEIGLLITKIKSILVNKKDIMIGIVCYENMLCDMSNMETLFGVKLEIRYISRIQESITRVKELKELGVDYIIGGQITCRDANSLGIPSLVYGSSEESIQEALREAKKLSFAMDLKNERLVQYKVGLSNSMKLQLEINTNGYIIGFDGDKEIIEKMHGDECMGVNLIEMIPVYDQEQLYDLLAGNTDRIKLYVNLNNIPFYITCLPICEKENVIGANVYLYMLNENKVDQNPIQNRSTLSGYFATATFDSITTKNAEMAKEIETAKRYAQSDRTIILYTEEGTEYFMFAEAIHNYSNRRSGPFVTINLDAIDEEEQMLMLFGKDLDGRLINPNAAMAKAESGTLFIKGIDKANDKLQHQLARTLMSRNIVRTDSNRMDNYNVRIIASSKTDLNDLVNEGSFSEELFYIVQGLIVHVLPLRVRKEDLLYIFETTFQTNCERYNRTLKLTSGAKERITKLKWSGNHAQIISFCESLVLSANKKNVDEIVIQNLYDSLYPNIQNNNGKKRVVVYSSPEAEEINKLLEQYHGSRNLVAQELGISTTTLWRKMKKYGIEPKYQE